MSSRPAFTDFSLERKELPAARRASSVWSKCLLSKRLQVIRRFRHSLAEYASELAELAASDSHPVQEVLVSEVLPPSSMPVDSWNVMLPNYFNHAFWDLHTAPFG